MNAYNKTEHLLHTTFKTTLVSEGLIEVSLMKESDKLIGLVNSHSYTDNIINHYWIKGRLKL